MSFFKKLFKTSKAEPVKQEETVISNLPLDQIFVQKFIEKGGKFLYCTTLDEVTNNINEILKENAWETLSCNDYDLTKIVKTLPIKIEEKLTNFHPIFIGCEHLIAEKGSILFSSNQIKETKLSELAKDFIVYANTSQLVKTEGESLTGVKSRYQGNIPSNISAIKRYNVTKNEDFMNYGNTNSKNLYLILFEDL